MRSTQLTDQRLDITVSARVFNGCWLMANIGMAIFQVRLLALAWQQSHLALWPACLASTWIVGSVLIFQLDLRQQRSARLWSVCFALCALVCVSVSHLLNSLAPPYPSGTALSIYALASFALLMGMMSAGWLGQRRPWPPVDERISLAKGLLSTMLGLWVVWVFPLRADALGLICISPLLALDFWPQGQCPLPLPGKLLDNWYDTTQGAAAWQLQLRKHKLPRGWLWSYLAQRERLSLIFLASSVAVLLGGIWSSVPTAFAAALLQMHEVHLLGWLVLGQLVALAIAAGCFMAARGVLGAADRLIPRQWQLYAWFAAEGGLFLMAASLLALGLPAFQSPWGLAGSIALYTLAAALWGILRPRLQPGLNTLVFSQRHLIFGQENTQLLQSQLAYERAQEEHAGRLLSTTEGILTAIIAPAIAMLVDRWSVDGVLIAAGLFLLAFLSIATMVLHDRQEGCL